MAPVFFGIALGAALPAMVGCPSGAIPAMTCYEQGRTIGAVTWYAVKIPAADRPPILAGDINVGVIGGKVAHLDFWTHGALTQESDLATLKAKLGEPSKVDVSDAMNGYGAHYSLIAADWTIAPDIRVHFDGMLLSGPRLGMVEVSSAAYIAATERRNPDQVPF